MGTSIIFFLRQAIQDDLESKWEEEIVINTATPNKQTEEELFYEKFWEVDKTQIETYMSEKGISSYKNLLIECGIEHHTFHALRHSFATRCIEKGFDAKVLSEILGHADVKITLDRYVHPSLERKRQCMELLS